MPATVPDHLCRLFQQAMAAGDIEAVLNLYDPDAVFVNAAGTIIKGSHGLRQALAPLAAAQTRFDFVIKQVVQAGDIALMHTAWTVSGPEPLHVYALEVARRQGDGTWRWLIGDPYTVGRQVGAG
ncbi:YybH family protein [Candidatus Methylocalor cossyra]|uniref:SnoaL-like domain-containing protein n=1 Tax=Candidatus Methylocalor cossyra TaxID=3108543 RepID=A0ABM9NJT5_9GAMM